MKKVLNITERLRNKKRQEQREAYHHKADSIQRIVQCASCHHRCGMCGSYLNDEESPDPNPIRHLDVTLCEDCRSEYDDFLQLSDGNKNAELFWHNREWAQMWSDWTKFQEAIKAFKKSIEFKQLNDPH
jgi:hypothetical protein